MFSEKYADKAHLKKIAMQIAQKTYLMVDSSKFNNYSTKGNTNPYTGKKGYANPYKAKKYKPAKVYKGK